MRGFVVTTCYNFLKLVKVTSLYAIFDTHLSLLNHLAVRNKLTTSTLNDSEGSYTLFKQKHRQCLRCYWQAKNP